jgi:hypothetical protein
MRPEIITPAVASEWLTARRACNDRPIPAKVEAFVKLMQSGKWRIDLANPRQPIILRRCPIGARLEQSSNRRRPAGAEGFLLEEGLHRLTAIATGAALAECYVDAPADLVIASPKGRFLFAVSPARAAAWLGNDRPGRALALDYALAMAEGRWQPNPEDPIVLTAAGVAEGHHRLLAVILADTPVPLWVDWL